MSYISLVPILVTAAPAVILGAVCIVEASIRESIGQ